MLKDRLQPGQRVRFRLGDIHLPALSEVMARMSEDTELQGQITLLSDQGEAKAAFAVVEVQGVLVPLIVPASSIRVTSESGEPTPKASSNQRDLPFPSAV